MVSIILPAYNAEPWLRQCVESVLAQTVGDWELIIADDGSADGTLALARHCAETDARIRVVAQPNGGPSAARNLGLDHAAGEWVAFVDADDLLHPRFLEALLSLAASSGAEIVSCGFTRAQPWPPLGLSATLHARALTPEEAIEDLLYQRAINSAPWSKLFRRALFDKVRFPLGILYEDLEIMPRLFEQCSGPIACAALPLYYYCPNPASLLATFNAQRLDVLSVTQQIYDRYCPDPRLEPAAFDRRFAANFNIYLLASQNQAYREEAKQCWDNIRSWRRRILMNRDSRLKNRLGAILSWLGPGVVRLAGRLSMQKGSRS